MAYNCIIVETRGKVGLVRLNRPKQLNALNDELMNELGDALTAFETDEKIGAIVITGSDKAFAAGADVAEMKDNSFAHAYNTNFVTRNWDCISGCRKPVIAAVAGHALGGGCEIALACDFIIAADNAVFGQPEVKLAFIPGAGGTQRLPRLIGKAGPWKCVSRDGRYRPRKPTASGSSAGWSRSRSLSSKRWQPRR